MALVKDAVFTVAEEMLTSVVNGMTAAGIVLPTRRYVHAGEVAFDCEQLVVTGLNLGHAMPGEAAAIAQVQPPRHAAIDVFLIRCVPVQDSEGKPPSPAALTSSAEAILTDLYGLAYVLWAGYRAGEWASTCESVLLGQVVVVGPEGGFGGVHASVFIQIT